MKFLINYSDTIIQNELDYLSEECSFFMGTFNQNVDIEWVLNKVSLASSNGLIFHVSGYCGLAGYMNSNICIPKFKKGSLKVEHNLKNGFAYNIFDEDQPVYLNINSGWVCIGDPLKLGNGVEFIQNCVAVISNNGDFLSLWLKPKSLPNFL